MSTRTSKRSRSGAYERCPHCGKKLRGEKGVKRHLADMHGEAAAPTPAPSSPGQAPADSPATQPTPSESAS